MCRMIMFIGKYNVEIYKFFKAFVKAASCDHVLGKYYSKQCEQHSDGWGTVIIEINSESRYLIYKSLNPIFEDENVLRNLLERYENKNIAVIAHARKAATSPKNIQSVHPFSYITDKATIIFLAHNGVINKKFISKELGLSKEIAQKLCEGHLFTMWLSRLWAVWREAIKTMINNNVIKVSPNSFIIELLDDDLFLYSISYLNVNKLAAKIDAEKLEFIKEYYRIYYLIYNNSIIVSTSTIPDYVKDVQKNIWNTLSLEGEYIKINKNHRISIEKF